jgi:guanosine-3',5'-bis(diphosphate) 3'-pyrophosphohydrolase
MRMLDHVPINDQSKITEEIKHIYIPLTHILGLNYVQIELENLYLKCQYKTTYDAIANHIRTNKATNPGFLDRFAAPIHAALQQEFKQQYTLKARTKSIASIWNKIKTRDIAFEDIHDLYAVRIVFDSEPAEEHINCWLIYELVTTLYEPRLDRLRDWLTYPKDNGYEALHITVLSPEGQWVEIQIRTTRMDKQAEHGHAAHWKYKDHRLTKELADIDPNWFDQARKFLTHKWEKQQNTLDIRVDDLYVKPSN